MEAAIKMLTLDNICGTGSVKQHAFIPKVYKDKYTDEMHVGNVAMCGKSMASDDGEKASLFVELEDEPLNPDKVCKKCLAKLKALGAYVRSN